MFRSPFGLFWVENEGRFPDSGLRDRKRARLSVWPCGGVQPDRRTQHVLVWQEWRCAFHTVGREIERHVYAKTRE